MYPSNPFTPLHAPPRPSTPLHVPLQAHHVPTSAAATAWGAVAIDEHLARQRGARAMRDDRDARCKFADGSKYTGRPTKPQPFVLGQTRGPGGPRLHKLPCESRLRGPYDSLHSVLHRNPGGGMPGGGMGMADGEWATPVPTTSGREAGSDAGGGSGSSARDEPSPAVPRTASADYGGDGSSVASGTPVLIPNPDEPCWLRQVQEVLGCGPPGQWSRDRRAVAAAAVAGGALPPWDSPTQTTVVWDESTMGNPALLAGATLPLREGFTFDFSRVN